MAFPTPSAVLCSLYSLFSVIRAAGAPGLVQRTWNGTKYGCKCYYDDPCWPSQSDWAALNKTLDGNLIVDVPPGAVCHNTFNGPLGTLETYDAAACAQVTANFGNEQWTYVGFPLERLLGSSLIISFQD